VSEAPPRSPTTWPLAAVLALGFALGSTRLISLDLPLMLANGDVILSSGGIPRTNVFSWTNPDHGYLNDKWGFMVLVSAVHGVAGATGLSILKASLGAVLAGLVFAVARVRNAPWTAAGMAALGMAMLAYRLHLRAEVVSFIAVAATLRLLPEIRASKRWSWAAVVGMVPIAAACHGYWILVPIVVVVVGVAASEWRTAAIGVAALLAAVVSPYGLANLAHPFRVLAQLDTGLGEAITELGAPFGGPLNVFHGLAVLCALGAVAAVVSALRRRCWEEAALLVLVVVLAFRIDRNLALLGLVPALMRAPARATWVGLAGPLLLVGIASGVPRIALGRSLGPGWEERMYPRRVAAEVPADARYVNDLSIGSFLVLARGTAFIDGNTEGYPPAFLADYRDMLAGATGIADVDERFQPDGYLLRHTVPTTRAVILGLFLSIDYAPTQWDDVATAFEKTDDPEQADDRWRTWMRDVYAPHAATFFTAPEDAGVEGGRADLATLRNAVEACPYHAPFYEALAEAYDRSGDLLRAARCTRLATRLGPP
jgi:hypothetical protein